MIEQNAWKYRVKARARDFTNLLAKSGGSDFFQSKAAAAEQLLILGGKETSGVHLGFSWLRPSSAAAATRAGPLC